MDALQSKQKPMPATACIDVNCDMGEGMPTDAAIMPFISSANIATGWHAGSEAIIRETIGLCLKHQVAVGIHPGFDDKPNFGRTEQQLSHEALYNLLMSQFIFFKETASAMGVTIHHVKPHGAMYNMAARDAAMAKVIAQAVYDTSNSWILYGLAGSQLTAQAKLLGLQTASEVFADRSYQPDGSLTPRWQPGALITSHEAALQQALQLAQQKRVHTLAGQTIELTAETLCIHGDGEHAVDFARQIHDAFTAAGISIRAVQ